MESSPKAKAESKTWQGQQEAHDATEEGTGESGPGQTANPLLRSQNLCFELREPWRASVGEEAPSDGPVLGVSQEARAEPKQLGSRDRE